jgi:tRNA 2-selenouridine synthase
MLQRINIAEYLLQQPMLPIIDVRTPAEFEVGHIPGAFNIPLFSNEERAHVGTVYKKQSSEQAIKLGYKYVTPKLEEFVRAAKEAAVSGEVVVYCWRGGMRSKAFAEHIHESGFKKVFVIEDGYKGYRRYALDSFDRASNIHVLGGYTGSGKTRILEQMNKDGHQVIDLEGLSNHKGSAFGGIGQEAQPTTEHFANLLFWKWKEMDLSKPIWVEDESSNIGRVNIPENFFTHMRNSKVWFLKMPKEQRAKILVEEYASCDREGLAGAIQRISKKLGGLRTTEALNYLNEDNYYETALITLDYYDKFYLKGLERREKNNVIVVESDSIDEVDNAKLIISSS